MNLAFLIRGAFETLNTQAVSDDMFLHELRMRGNSVEDSQLVLQKALLEGFLERLPSGELKERAGSLAQDQQGAGQDGGSSSGP